MKRILLLASLVTLSCAVRAETVRMFALNMNQLSNTGVSTARAGALDAFLENGETPLDFGYFYGMKAASYFNYSHSGYTFGKNSDGKYVIAYREGFSLLKEYTGLTQEGNHPIRCFVLQDASERLYAPMFYVGNNYDKVVYWKAIWDAVDAVKQDYPSAKVYLMLMEGYWGADLTGLQAYITAENAGVNTSGLGMILAADGNGEGGYVYAHPDSTLNATGGAVAIGTEETYLEHYKAIVCTATYARSSHTVVFKDYKGDVIDTQEVEDKAAAVAPTEIPTPEGMVFYKWSTDFSCVESDLEVTATYIDPLTTYFTVKFLDINGDEIPGATQQVLFEQDAVPPEPPEVSDFVFLRWEGDYTGVREDLVIESRYRRGIIPVGTVEELVSGLADFAAEGADYILTNDIDLAGVAYVPVDLYGCFDGNGHSLANLSGTEPLFETVYGSVKDLRLVGFSRSVVEANSRAACLADSLKGGFVSGVTVEDGSVVASKSTCTLGTVVAVAAADGDGNPSVVSNCVAKNCSIKGANTNTLGGLVGTVSGGSEVVECRFLTDDSETASLNGSAAEVVGGVVGSSEGGLVRSCYAEGSFSVAAGNQQKAAAGGIVGFVSGSRTDVVGCTNRATVAYANYNGAAGGIVGRGQKSRLVISGCVNYGAVSVTATDDTLKSYAGCGAGGIFGGSWGVDTVTVIVDSRNEGPVVSEDTRAAGGILGEDHGSDNSDVVCYLTNCVNVASVSSLARAGGVVGRLHRLKVEFSLVNCGNAGAISCPTGAVGGVVGVILGVPQNNDKSFLFEGIRNVMNCGALATESGTVGKFVGVLEGSERNAYKAQVQSGFFVARENTDVVGRVGGKDGTGVTVDEASVTDCAAEAFANRTVMKKLNVYAAANGLPLWVQLENHPDLSLFSAGKVSGLIVIVR